MRAMRIAIISPYSIGPIRGNITTVNRISSFLRGAGVDILVLPADVFSATEMERQLISFNPQLIHAFHARYCGGLAEKLAERFKLPYLLTITGSDLHDPLLRNHPDTVRALAAAQVIVCFHYSEAAMLAGHFPQVAERLTVIPQGVEVLPVVSAGNFGLPDDAFVLLLPAALRKVKQVEFPIQALAPLASRIPAMKLVIAGGVIDKNYANTIYSLLVDAPYAEWLGEIPQEQMGALYSRADVVLNCSRFESMPGAIQEAMALKRPVLASDIAGNRALIQHGDTGLLYQDADSFIKWVVKLADDAGLRAELGRRAGEFVDVAFSPQSEAKKYIDLYQSLIA